MNSSSENSHLKRDQHLFGPGPKRILALDGGGVRGAISVAFLERMETILRDQTGPKSVLGDWFDLIGGTSTGAIIAGGVALGFNTSQLEEFYRLRAHRVFRRSFGRIPGIRSRFDARMLSAEIELVVGNRTLDTPDLATGFALVTKRIDTGSPWIIANNPRSIYWDTPLNGSFIGNRHYQLSNLVRASTAAPFYFDPEVITIHAANRMAYSSMAASRLITIHRSPFFNSRLFRPINSVGRPASTSSLLFP